MQHDEPVVSVVILSADEDTVILRHRLRDAGFHTAGVYLQELDSGEVDLRSFLERHEPDVVVCDLSSTKPRTLLLQTVQRLCSESGARCVLTLPERFDARRMGLPELNLDTIACVLMRPCDFELTRLAIGCALRAERGEERDGGMAA